MRMLPLMLTACLGMSCAAKKMAAKNADLLIENQIEKRMPLYTAQKKALAKDVDLFLTEQKEFAKEALPALNNVELKSDKVDSQYDHLDQIYRKLAVNFSKLMSKYMALLDEKQQKDFHVNLEAENKAMARIEGSERMEKIYDRFETVLGSISDEQKKILEAHKPYLDERYSIRLKRREALHAKFREIYQLELSSASRTQYFIDAFSQYQNSYPDNAKNKEILKQMLPTFTTRQKAELKERVNDLKEIIGFYLETDY